MRCCLIIALVIATVSGCSDTSADCAFYKEAGYCETYKDTLKEMCAASCGFCSGGGGGGDGGEPGEEVDPRPAREPERPELCRDTCSTKDCGWYKQQGHCEKYAAVMVMNCASTCGWCGARTCSPPDVENGWTDFENTMVPSGANINVFCYDGFSNAGSSVISCNAYGEIDGQPRCVAIVADGGSPVQQSDCQRAAKSAMESTYANGQFVVPQASTHYVPQCDDYQGNYKEIQYDGSKGETFCVDSYRGSEIQGTRIRGQHEYISCAPGAAKEYYDRLASEQAASNYNYDNSQPAYNYDNSQPAYNYDNSEPAYNYDNSGYDYNYDTSSYDTSSYDNSGYDNSGYDSSGYDYNYDTSDYDAGTGGDDYYAAGGEDYYNADYADSNSGDGYYAESGDDYYAAGGEDYYNADYADSSSGDGYYAEDGGFDASYYYADQGDEKAEDAEYLYSATAAEGSLGDVVEEEAVASVEDAAEPAEKENTKDMRYRWRNRRNRRDAEASEE